MENQNNENENSLNLNDGNEQETLETEAQTETLSAEELKTLREKAKLADELEEKNKKLFERAKKAEANKKEDKVDSGLTARDVLILSGAGYTHEEDIEVIERWAKFNGVSVKDALNDSTLKTVLLTRSEERKTAQATASKGSARGVSTPSAEVLIAEASKGKLPDESKIDDLANARMALRKAKSGK